MHYYNTVPTLPCHMSDCPQMLYNLDFAVNEQKKIQQILYQPPKVSGLLLLVIPLKTYTFFSDLIFENIPNSSIIHLYFLSIAPPPLENCM